MTIRRSIRPGALSTSRLVLAQPLGITRRQISSVNAVDDTADRFRHVAADLADTIAAVPDDAWSNPSPCDGWTARDVLAHLVEWIPAPGFLLGTYGIDTGPIPPVETDPLGAWQTIADAVQAALDDPATAGRVEDCGSPGELSFAAAVDMTCTSDVLIHTWDIAQAAGIDVTLDVGEIARQHGGLDSIPPAVDEAMRTSGMFGPRIDVPDDADQQTKVLGFYGRRASPRHR